MRRVRIANLNPGLVLQKPLYDSRNTLLLAAGKKLSTEMVATLKASGLDYAFMGELTAKGRRLLEQRDEAEKLSREIREEFERLLLNEDLAPAPAGVPLAEQTPSPFRSQRSAAEIQRVADQASDAELLVKDIADGGLHEDEVGQAALETVTQLSSALSADPSIASLLAQARSNDDYLFRHSVNVSVLAMQIALALGYSEEQLVQVGLAALLQDLGMAMVPVAIASQARRLDAAEMIDIQKHTFHSVYLIERFRGLQLIPRFVAMQCHERADGTGYPRRRPKRLIHVFARIVAVADVYDALTSDRPWRKAFHPYDAIETLIREANKGLYDADAVRGLLHVLSLYPIGSYVRLNTGETARVVHANGAQFSKPVVSVLIDAEGKPLSAASPVDLTQEASVSVKEIVRNVPESPSTVGF